MDEIQNPFNPGAGSPPPELAGRDAICEQLHVVIERAHIGLGSKHFILTGFRGVGKTVLLNHVCENSKNAYGLWTEAAEGRSLPALLRSDLKAAMADMLKMDRARKLAAKTLGLLEALEFKYENARYGLNRGAKNAPAQRDELEQDMRDLLTAAGKTAKQAEKCMVLFVDEMQTVSREDLASLISILHQTSRKNLPVIMIGAGLPNLLAKIADVKSYGERFFGVEKIGWLNEEHASQALQKPAQAMGVEFSDPALKEIFRKTRGYPYFLQEWGSKSWNAAKSSPITLEDVQIASRLATDALSEGFFYMRMSRLSLPEAHYLRAMAEADVNDDGVCCSSVVAKILKKPDKKLALVRNRLIGKGMAYSPQRGAVAFTAPLFAQFLKRDVSYEE